MASLLGITRAITIVTVTALSLDLAGGVQTTELETRITTTEDTPDNNNKARKSSQRESKGLLSLFWGGRQGSAFQDNLDDDDDFREDRQKIKETLRKFYRLADPKFAKASLASAKQKNLNQASHSLKATEGNGGDNEDNDEDDLLPGTVLQVYRWQKELPASDNGDDNGDSEREDYDTEYDDLDDDGEGDETLSLLEDHAYELVERMQLELGATPKHYMDFAYKSVTDSSSSNDRWRGGDTDNINGNSNSDNLAIIEDSLVGDRPVCNAVVPSKELFSPPSASDRSQRDYGKPNGDNSDRAMAFFASWWKWWLPFANSQWWKNNGTSKTDYDIGDSPFAGGSIGEVWRGRRKCRRARKSSHNGRGDPRQKDSGNENAAFFNSHRQKGTDRHSSEEDGSDDNWAGEEFEFVDEDGEQEEDTHNNKCDDQTPLVLKRLRVERGYLLLEAGLREVYFGKLIARVLKDTKPDMYTVYVDHFFREVPRRQQPSRAFGGLPTANPKHRGRTNDLELWIVYEDAGPSLRSYIYSPIVSEGGFVMYQHSKLWTKLRTFADGEDATATQSDSDSDIEGSNTNTNDWEDSSVEVLMTDEEPAPDRKASTSTFSNETRNQDRKTGRTFLQKTLRKVLAAAAELHKRGIVHRDIKPSNVMCQTQSQSDPPLPFEELLEWDALPTLVCKLGDFSSGWDRYTSEHLYTKGPTPGEQTDEYAPPESYVGPYWKPFDEDKPQSYDSWSIGVLALELLLGTPNVFSVDQRTSALLTNKLKRARASDEDIAYALYLAALSNFCIFVPSYETSKREESWPLRYGDPLHKTAMVKESCSLQDFHHALRARDPLGIGFDSSTDLLLHLIWQLLAFDPSERMTAEEALRHPYFISPDGTLESLHQIPGYHNALISEMLDARLDFDVEDDIKTFECPSCGRVFHDWRSCHQHANLRKHAKFCAYNHTVLPSCINTHSMLPEHPTSGYCDLQGRRKTIEDFHSIHLHHEHQFYGIFDGHTGNLASKFAASELYTELITQLPDLMQIEGVKSSDSPNTNKNTGFPANDDRHAWKEEIRINVTRAFETVHERFLDRIKTMTTPISEVGSAPQMDQSGTTATALLVTQDVVIAAVLGDSRGVLASTKKKISTPGSGSGSSSSSSRSSRKSAWKNFPEVSAIPFSIDHVASDPTERDLVLHRGGFVSKSGNSNTARVNGTLAITRSIGDANLAPVLSREPHVRAFDRSELRDLCGDLGRDSSGDENDNRTVIPCFAILASDGLWDVMSNQEAVDMVVDIIIRHNEANAFVQSSGITIREVVVFDDDGDGDDDEGSGGPFQEAAERLAVEAYVRGSTDNIGVCVVAID